MLNHPNISPWPFFEADEVEAASQTLLSGKVNYWTGEQGKLFEVTYAKLTQKPYGIALANGTVALELALRSLGIKAGDEVIVASRSYVASASCVLLVGASPVFADIDKASGNITAETIAPCITSKTKAIIPVHVGGWPCDMTAIMALAEQHNLKVIEDCAQAHGAFWQGKPVGAFGDAAIFSFCQDKIISTGGEGGMLVLDDVNSFERAWAYKDIGRSFDAVYRRSHPPGFRWLTESAGSNFRMTEFQAAIGLVQLKKLNTWIEKRNNNAQELIASLEKFDFFDIPQVENQATKNAFYRLYIHVKKDRKTKGIQNLVLRDQIVSLLNNAGIPAAVGSCAEVYREVLFSGLETQRLPQAQFFAENVFCLPCHHTLSAADISHMRQTIENTLENHFC